MKKFLLLLLILAATLSQGVLKAQISIPGQQGEGSGNIYNSVATRNGKLPAKAVGDALPGPTNANNVSVSANFTNGVNFMPANQGEISLRVGDRSFQPILRDIRGFPVKQVGKIYAGAFQITPNPYEIKGKITVNGGVLTISNVVLKLVVNINDTTVVPINPDGTYLAEVFGSDNIVLFPSCLPGYSIDRAFYKYSNVSSNYSDQNFTYTAKKFNIGGTITVSGGPRTVSEVTKINYTEQGVSKTATVTNGKYNFNADTGTLIVITPVPLAGYEVTTKPDSFNVTGNATDKNIIYTARKFDISGTVTVNGGLKVPDDATISYTVNGGQLQTAAVSGGIYTFKADTGAAVVITPNPLMGYTVTATPNNFTAVKNVTDKNVVYSVKKYSVSGEVSINGGSKTFSDIPDLQVSIKGIPKTINVNDVNGSYTVNDIDSGFSVTVALVHLTGYTESAPVAISSLTENKTFQNLSYTAVQYSVSGTATVEAGCNTLADLIDMRYKVNGLPASGIAINVNPSTGQIGPVLVDSGARVVFYKQPLAGYNVSRDSAVVSAVSAPVTNMDFDYTLQKFSVGGNINIEAGGTLACAAIAGTYSINNKAPQALPIDCGSNTYKILNVPYCARVAVKLNEAAGYYLTGDSVITSSLTGAITDGNFDYKLNRYSIKGKLSFADPGIDINNISPFRYSINGVVNVATVNSADSTYTIANVPYNASVRIIPSVGTDYYAVPDTIEFPSVIADDSTANVTYYRNRLQYYGQVVINSGSHLTYAANFGIQYRINGGSWNNVAVNTSTGAFSVLDIVYGSSLEVSYGNVGCYARSKDNSSWTSVTNVIRDTIRYTPVIYSIAGNVSVIKNASSVINSMGRDRKIYYSINGGAANFVTADATTGHYSISPVYCGSKVVLRAEEPVEYGYKVGPDSIVIPSITNDEIYQNFTYRDTTTKVKNLAVSGKVIVNGGTMSAAGVDIFYRVGNTLRAPVYSASDHSYILTDIPYDSTVIIYPVVKTGYTVSGNIILPNVHDTIINQNIIYTVNTSSVSGLITWNNVVNSTLNSGIMSSLHYIDNSGKRQNLHFEPSTGIYSISDIPYGSTVRLVVPEKKGYLVQPNDTVTISNITTSVFGENINYAYLYTASGKVTIDDGNGIFSFADIKGMTYSIAGGERKPITVSSNGNYTISEKIPHGQSLAVYAQTVPSHSLNKTQYISNSVTATPSVSDLTFNYTLNKYSLFGKLVFIGGNATYKDVTLQYRINGGALQSYNLKDENYSFTNLPYGTSVVVVPSPLDRYNLALDSLIVPALTVNKPDQNLCYIYDTMRQHSIEGHVVVVGGTLSDSGIPVAWTSDGQGRADVLTQQNGIYSIPAVSGRGRIVLRLYPIDGYVCSPDSIVLGPIMSNMRAEPFILTSLSAKRLTATGHVGVINSGQGNLGVMGRKISCYIDGVFSHEIETFSDGGYVVENIQYGSKLELVPRVENNYLVSAERIVINSLTTDTTNLNFIYSDARQNNYTVSGTVHVDKGYDVGRDITALVINYQKTYMGTSSLGVTYPDASGNYSITDVYRSTDIKIYPQNVLGYTLFPDTIALANIKENKTHQDFVYTHSTSDSLSITGTVRTNSNYDLTKVNISVKVNGKLLTRNPLADGTYSIRGIPKGASVTIVPAAIVNYTITPDTISIMSLRESKSNQDFWLEHTDLKNSYIISGSVSITPQGSTSVTVVNYSLNGANTQTSTVGADGRYSLPPVNAGTNVKVWLPDIAGYSAFAKSITLTNVQQDHPDVNFIYIKDDVLRNNVFGRVYILGGTIPVENRIVRYKTGVGKWKFVATVTDGSYVISDLAINTNLRIEPVSEVDLQAYKLAPASRNITVKEDITGQDFVYSIKRYSIKGTVNIEDGWLTLDSLSNKLKYKVDGNPLQLLGLNVATGEFEIGEIAYGSKITMHYYKKTHYVITPSSMVFNSVKDSIKDANITYSLERFNLSGGVAMSDTSLPPAYNYINKVFAKVNHGALVSLPVGVNNLYNRDTLPYGTHVVLYPMSIAGYTAFPDSIVIDGVDKDTSNNNFTYSSATYRVAGHFSMATGSPSILSSLKEIEYTVNGGHRIKDTVVNGYFEIRNRRYGENITLYPPVIAGYVATPNYLVVAGLSEDTLNNNFVYSINRFDISGRVTISGGNLTYSGMGDSVYYHIRDGITRKIAIDGSGNYAITNVPYGTGISIWVPTVAGYTIAPTDTIRISSVTTSLTDENFNYTIKSFRVSGNVTVKGGTLAIKSLNYKINGISGVATVYSDGGYVISTNVPFGSRVVITPAQQTGYTLSSDSLVIASIEQDSLKNDITYTVKPCPVFGKVSITNGVLTLSELGVVYYTINDGAVRATVIDSTTGAYVIPEAVYGNKVVIMAAAYTGYDITPAVQITFSALTDTSRNNDFVYTLKKSSVSGYITANDNMKLSDVPIYVNMDGALDTIYTVANGRFKISDIPFGASLVLTPSIADCYVVSPLFKNVFNVTASIDLYDVFRYSVNTYTLRGAVSVTNGGLLSSNDRTVYYTINHNNMEVKDSVYTKSDGSFTIDDIPCGSSVELTPKAESGYSVTPKSLLVTNVTNNIDTGLFIYRFTNRSIHDVFGTVSVIGGALSNAGLDVNYSINGVPQTPVKTGAGGAYALLNIYDSSRVVVTLPAKVSYVALPDSLVINTLIGTMHNQNLVYVCADSGTYTASGRVFIDGGALDLTAVNLSYSINGVSMPSSIRPSSNGDYTISNLPFNSNVVIKPSMETNYKVSPDSIAIASLRGNTNGHDFVYTSVPTPATVSWLGMVEVRGGSQSAGNITVNYSIDGGAAASVLTEADGRYKISNIDTGKRVSVWIDAATYPDYAITPDSIKKAAVSTSVINADFLLEYRLSVDISGTVSFAGDSGYMSVHNKVIYYAINGNNIDSVYTDKAGQWVITNVPRGSEITITSETIDGYVVSPTSLVILNVVRSYKDINFVYTASGLKTFVVTGNVAVTGGPLSVVGIKIPYTVNGVADTVITRSDGSYVIPNLPYKSKVVITPLPVDDYAVAPQALTFNSLDANETGVIIYTFLAVRLYDIGGLVIVSEGKLLPEQTTVSYTVNGVAKPAVPVTQNGSYIITGLSYGDSVAVISADKVGYTVSPANYIIDSIKNFRNDLNFVYTVKSYPIFGKVSITGGSLALSTVGVVYYNINGGETQAAVINRATGEYKILGAVYGDTIKITAPECAGYKIMPDSVINIFALSDTSRGNDFNYNFDQIILSGYITSDGSMSLTGVPIYAEVNGVRDTVYTLAGGLFTILNIPEGASVRLTPSTNDCYAVSPSFKNISDVRASLNTGNVFHYIARTYTLRGAVSVTGGALPVSDRTVYYSINDNGLITNDSIITASDGSYNITNIHCGSSITLTPKVEREYNVTPASLAVSNITSNIDTGLFIYHFTNYSQHDITGTISVIGGRLSASGLTVNYSVNGSTSSVTTAADGSYVIPSVRHGSSVLISVLVRTGYLALPDSISIDTLVSALSNQNFVYISTDSGIYTASGHVFIDGGALDVKTVTLNYSVNGVLMPFGVKPSNNGDYIISNLPFGSRVVIKPSAETNYTVSPDSNTIASLRSNINGQDFVYTPVPVPATVSWYGIVEVNGGPQSASGITVNYSVDGVASSVLTGADGRYTITGLTVGKRVNAWIDAATYSEYAITPDSITEAPLANSKVNADFLLKYKLDVNIAGTVSFTPSGQSVNNRKVNYVIDDTVFGAVYTDVAGQWIIPNVPRGSDVFVTVPEIENYVSPHDWLLVNVDRSISNVHLVYTSVTLKTFSLTGYVAVTGGTLSAAGIPIPYTVDGVLHTDTTRADGSYAIYGLPYKSNVVITPIRMSEYEVSPRLVNFDSIQVNQTANILYIHHSLVKYTISGLVTVADGSLRPEEVVINYTVNGAPKSVVVAANGNYFIDSLPRNAKVVLTPEKKNGYSVTLSERVFDSVQDFYRNINFVYTSTAKNCPVSGKVRITDGSLTLSQVGVVYYNINGGKTQSAVINTTTGEYSISNTMIGDTVTITAPVFAGYTVSPNVNITINSLADTSRGNDFTYHLNYLSLSGYITMSDSSNLAGIPVHVNVDGTPDTVYTVANGLFTVTDIPFDATVVLDAGVLGCYSASPTYRIVKNVRDTVKLGNVFHYIAREYFVYGFVSVTGGNMSASARTVYYAINNNGVIINDSVTTDKDGSYFVTNIRCGSSITLTPKAEQGYDVNPSGLTISDINSNTEASMFVYHTNTGSLYDIFGTVSVMGGTLSVSGLTVNYSTDSVTSSVTTADDGSYVIAAVHRGSKVTVSVPYKVGYTALPDSILIDTLRSTLSNQNFVYVCADSGNYSVSGRVFVDGGTLDVTTVTLKYSVNGVSPDTNGDYTIKGVPFGSRVVIIPSAKANYTVFPDSITITSLRSDLTGQDFIYTPVPTPATVSWHGTVKVHGGSQSASGITVNYSVDSTVSSVLTGADGRYTITGLAVGKRVNAWINAATYPDYTITPDSIIKAPLVTSVVNADFLLDHTNSIDISGTVSFVPSASTSASMSVSGRKVDYSGSVSGSVYTDAVGQWTIPDVPKGSNILVTVPDVVGYVTPAAVSLTKVADDIKNVHLIYTDTAVKTYVITGYVAVTGGWLSASNVKIPYTLGGVSDTVITRADGSYMILKIPYKSDVVITPPVENGYDVMPWSVSFNSIQKDNMVNIIYVEQSLMRYAVSGLVTVVSARGNLRPEQAVINYSIEDVAQTAATVSPSGNYLIGRIPRNSKVVLRPEKKAGYTVTPSEVIYDSIHEFYGDVNFVYTDTNYVAGADTSAPHAVSISVNGVPIMIDDTMEYTLPCGSDTIVIAVAHDTGMYCPYGKVITDIVRSGSYTKTYGITVVNPTAYGDTAKTYTLHIRKRFELYDIVEERYNNALVVINNPSVNGGYSFSEYTWYKSETKNGLGSVIGTKQYYSAGPNEKNLLNEEVYYYVVLREAKLGMEQTCSAKVVLRGDVKSLAVYPNPAPSRNKIYVTGLEGYDGNAAVSIFDMQGRVMFTGHISDILGGIYAPERAGMYLLKVVSEDGTAKAVKFVVK
ncbi:MAG: T9SS type A sorting domain-containing protein [Bacteroidales bacterium]|jgi:hypothetical protein|nr:T9SS type A sorting domain-containing protein [Bacteroidales bacterium]